MTDTVRLAVRLPAVLIALSCVVTPAWAQEEGAEQGEKELGWFYTAELGFTLAGGNATTNSLSFGGSVRYEWKKASWKIEGVGLRAEQTNRTRIAVGADPTDFIVVETSDSELTAESYLASTRYDRSLGGNWFAYGAASWLRNTFAGIDSRWTLGTGVGNAWFDTDRLRFKTDYGLTYTNQSDVVDDPRVSDSYVGIGVAADFWYKVTSTTEVESQLEVISSFSDGSNWRSNWLNSVQVAISEALALKASLLFQYNNLPALEAVPLENPLGTPTGETVPVELDKLDTFFTIGLVLSF
jgi:putative salt-induced outer membrane protein YdiY